MAAFLTETFTDTSNLALASHASDSGATWTRHPINASGDMRISNANRCRVATAASPLSLYYSSSVPSGADYSVLATIRAVSVPGSGYAGIAGRVDISASTFLWVIYNLGAGQWQLWETFAGNSATVGTYTQALSAGTDYVVKLTMVGATVAVYVDGVERIPFSATAVAAGRPGLVGNAAWDDSTGLHIDDFSALDYLQLHVVGDSIAAGMNASDTAHSWPSLLGAALDLDQVGNPVSATQIADQCTAFSTGRNQVYFTNTSPLDVWAWLTGYNDIRFFGTDANALEAYTRILRSAVAWLSRAVSDCYQANNGAWTFTGSWTDFISANVATKYTTTVGDKGSISVTGSAVTVAYLSRWGLGDGASFTVKIDGATVATIDANFGATGAGAGVGSPTPYVMMAKRFGGLAPGAHTVEVEMTTSGFFHIGFVTGNGETTKPEIRLCGPLKMNSTGYSSNSPSDQGSDAAVAAYANAIIGICRDAYIDGRIVKYANVNAYYSITEVDTDNVHPADTGHAHIKDAFLAAAVLPPGGGLLLKLPPMSFRPAMNGNFQG